MVFVFATVNADDFWLLYHCIYLRHFQCVLIFRLDLFVCGGVVFVCACSHILKANVRCAAEINIVANYLDCLFRYKIDYYSLVLG